MRKIHIWICLAAVALFLIGCGQTFRGVGDDMRRIGGGVRTIFVAD